MRKVGVHKQLGEFLRQRREKIDPDTRKIRTRKRRRTPGLRREEVAELAGISIDWYVRLEQGRGSLPSKNTVSALAKALELSSTERSHLMKLAIGNSGRIYRRETVPDNLKELINYLTTPAYIIGARYDILCWNRAATDLFGDFEAIPIGERNVLFQTFINREIRKKHSNWEDDAQRLLENFRSVYDLWSHEPEFTSLVDELSTLSPEFKKWWNAHQVRRSSSAEKIVRHPKKGEIKLKYSTFQSNDNPDLRLVLYKVEAFGPS